MSNSNVTQSDGRIYDNCNEDYNLNKNDIIKFILIFFFIISYSLSLTIEEKENIKN